MNWQGQQHARDNAIKPEQSAPEDRGRRHQALLTRQYVLDTGEINLQNLSGIPGKYILQRPTERGFFYFLFLIFEEIGWALWQARSSHQNVAGTTKYMLYRFFVPSGIAEGAVGHPYLDSLYKVYQRCASDFHKPPRRRFHCDRNAHFQCCSPNSFCSVSCTGRG